MHTCGGCSYLSCWRSSSARDQVLPAWGTAVVLNKQRWEPSEGLSGAPRPPGCSPSPVHTPPPSGQIHFHPVHLASSLSQAGWGPGKTELPGTCS